MKTYIIHITPNQCMISPSDGKQVTARHGSLSHIYFCFTLFVLRTLVTAMF